MDKTQLRKSIRQKKRQMLPQQIEEKSNLLTQAFLQSDAYKNADAIYGYLSYNQEVRTDAILQAAINAGKRVAVPKVYGDQMRFLWITDLSQVAQGYCGIPEPVTDEPVAQDPTALVLMPGLAFDREGHRIGYGGGFYDKFLAAEPNHPTVALCYDFQMLPYLETEAQDFPVDLVLWA